QVSSFCPVFYFRLIVVGYMAPPQISILGHSFIRRLAGFLQKRGHEHLMAKLSSLGSIRFHGVGGRTIAKVLKFDLGIIRRLSPDIIVLELGSNDLTKLPAQTVGSELETLVRYLHDEFNAVLEPIPYCLYWKHRGFWNSRENIYLPDGVHLNDLGNLKLFRSIRGAVIKAADLVG
ncbi:unnamed protein product, partial [Porites lobata]